MPAIKKKPLPQKYRDLRERSNALEEHRDCTVIAIAAICDISYDAAREALALSGCEERKGARNHEIRNALKRLGYRTQEVQITQHAVAYNKFGDGRWVKVLTKQGRAIRDTYPEAHRVLQSLTTHHPRRFKKQWAEYLDGRDCLILSTNHISACIDGVVTDWAMNKAVRIEEIWFLEKNGD